MCKVYIITSEVSIESFKGIIMILTHVKIALL